MRIAIDPGGTTGIAVRMDSGKVQTCATKDPHELYRFLIIKYDIVICEDFVAQRIDNYMRSTIRLVGAVTALAWSTGSPLAIQMPQTRKGFILRAEKLLKEEKHVIHQVDALAHLLAWEALNGTDKRPAAISKL